MILRAMKSSDITEIVRIHGLFYQHEFEIDELFDKMLSSFVVTGQNDEIVIAGGVRTIVESAILTNKEFDVKKRREALLKALHFSQHICNKHEYNQLHAFIQDGQWMKHLKKFGFVETRGRSLVMNVGG